MSADVCIRNGTALVGRELEPVTLGELRISADRIVSIGDIGDGPGMVVDAGGGYVLPGLVDSHVHLSLDGGLDPFAAWARPEAERAETVRRNGILALASGITAVRDLGSSGHEVIHYAGRCRDGADFGPRVLAAGRFLTPPDGHLWEYGRRVSGVDDARRAAQAEVDAGAGILKLMATGGFSDRGGMGDASGPASPGLTLEEMRAGVEVARAAGMHVAAHAHAGVGVAAALEAGIDTLEHGTYLDDSLARAVAEHDVLLIPTVQPLMVVRPGLGVPDDIVAKVEVGRRELRESVIRANRAGVRIAAGTDAGTILNPIGGLVGELEHYTQLGMTNEEALLSATVTAGEVLGEGVGVLRPGAFADVIVVGEDPRAGLDTLRHPRTVIAGGRVANMQADPDLEAR